MIKNTTQDTRPEAMEGHHAGEGDLEEDEYIESLIEIEDDLFWDVIIPAIVTLVATGALVVNRRMVHDRRENVLIRPAQDGQQP